MPVLILALIALAIFGAIGVMLATAVILESRAKIAKVPSVPAATVRPSA
jgi:hypothetical protein